MRYVRWLRDVRMTDVASVGGKNASIGELIGALGPLGVRVPDGFAVTADGYRRFLDANGLAPRIVELLDGVRKDDIGDLVHRGEAIRELLTSAELPADLAAEIDTAYRVVSDLANEQSTDVAVRSSATAEDLPGASFAGQQETFLNVRGHVAVRDAVKRAFASLYTPRAISYRIDMGFTDLKLALSVGVQKMVRSDLASAGVVFTLDPESGHSGVVLVTSSFGLGESVVQGRVGPDQFYVHKASLEAGFEPIVWRRLGTKETRVVYDDRGHRGIETTPVADTERQRFSIDDPDVLTLARWALAIEKHYSALAGAPTPMDIEWAKDGPSGDLYVVQARPETVHSKKGAPGLRIYTMRDRAEPIVTGAAVGVGVGVGKARIISDPRAIRVFAPGEVLVTEATDPDWEPIMKTAGGIVTERGGRTSHAAIVARELGIPAVVGAAGARRLIEDGAMVTLSCAESEIGRVYPGALRFDVETIDPAGLLRPRTKILLNVGNPEQALRLALLPSDGVGLARMEFVFAGWVGVHPLALTRYASLPLDVRREVDAATRGYADKTRFFVERLSEGIATIAAAFHPRPVILRFSDFKTNEYAKLVGGAAFEPKEENPMLGWRGASRYYHPRYEEGFQLEVAAVRRVREEMGLDNLHLIIPFCRTPEEGRKVIEAMRRGGLERGAGGLKVLVMAEIPSNVLLAKQFAEVFDGFSIGSNDLTQLTLGVDRDSTTVAPLFDERNEAVLWSCARVIEAAHAAGRTVGICGQAPSDYPEFAAFLVERGIDSISLNPDALVRTMARIVEVEQRLGAAGVTPRLRVA